MTSADQLDQRARQFNHNEMRKNPKVISAIKSDIKAAFTLQREEREEREEGEEKTSVRIVRTSPRWKIICDIYCCC